MRKKDNIVEREEESQMRKVVWNCFWRERNNLRNFE